MRVEDETKEKVEEQSSFIHKRKGEGEAFKLKPRKKRPKGKDTRDPLHLAATTPSGSQNTLTTTFTTIITLPSSDKTLEKTITSNAEKPIPSPRIQKKNIDESKTPSPSHNIQNTNTSFPWQENAP